MADAYNGGKVPTVEVAFPTCDFPNCNQIAGHEGSHGKVLDGAPGVVWSAYGGGEGLKGAAEPTNIPCDSCGAPFTLRRYELGGGEFSCTNCEQMIFIDKIGGIRSIKSSLYGRVKPGTKEHVERLDKMFRRLVYEQILLHKVGAITPKEAADAVARWQAEVAPVKAMIANPPKKWRFHMGRDPYRHGWSIELSWRHRFYLLGIPPPEGELGYARRLGVGFYRSTRSITIWWDNHTMEV